MRLLFESKIQNINGNPTVKCSERAIGYVPPIFSACTNQKTYQNLNKCNYIYITDYLYNHVNLIYVHESDIDKNNQIYPQLIINKQGKVEAAKVESQNKKLLDSYYQAIKSIPKAKYPAKFNGVNEYYGYNFPTSIYNIIKNSNDFNTTTTDNSLDHVNMQRLVKNYIHHLHEKGNIACKYKVQ